VGIPSKTYHRAGSNEAYDYRVHQPHRVGTASEGGVVRLMIKRKGRPRHKDYVRHKSYLAFICSHPCDVCVFGMQTTPTEPDHIKTRGAGGKDLGGVWPLCRTHHSERHAIGLKSFEEKYDTRAWFMASLLYAAYLEQWE
jgi:Putative HNHc nuclease